jgi:DNA polymerase III subunit delta
MVAFKAHEADRALARPDPKWRVWLIYGPDGGLVSERTAQCVKQALGKASDDPFRLVQLEGDDLASDPMRLLDEANTMGLFGGGRVIRISRSSKQFSQAIEGLLKAPPDASTVIIEAGELTAKSPLRAICERSPHAVALPCYGDDGKALGELVDTALREAGASIDRAAREQLLASLGSDRMVSRQEIGKLLLYVGASKRIEIADVDACVGDSAVRETDNLVDAAFAGRVQQADLAFGRLRAEGMEPATVAAAALRHALVLLTARLKIDSGQSAQNVADTMRLAFPRKAAAQSILRNWTAAMLADTIRSLGTAMAAARRHGGLAPELVQRAFLEIGRKASRSKPG